MRLNLDCVRDVLFCVEKHAGLRTFCPFVDVNSDVFEVFEETPHIFPFQSELLNSYDNDELFYHVRYCVDAGLLYELEDSSSSQIIITDLTPKGHEFIANARSNDNWNKAKEIGGKIGAFGLDMASKITEGVVTALLKQYLTLP